MTGCKICSTSDGLLIRLLSLLILSAAFLSACNAPQMHAGSVMRIVSLAPSTTETLFAIGAGNEVVGVSQYCDYPPQVRRLPKVGSFVTPNIEQIMALRPTLVIGLLTSSDLRQIRALQAVGIATLMVDQDSVAAIEGSIEQIGQRVGHTQDAKSLVARMRRQIAETEERLTNTSRPQVLMVVGHQPLVAVGAGTYLDELLTMAHAHNIASPVPRLWPRLSLEYVIARRPEIILDGQMGTDPHASSEFWTRYQSIPAVRDRRIFGYPDEPTLHPGPRVAQTLKLLAHLIHPEAFPSR